MQELKTFYQNRITEFTEQLSQLKKQLAFSSLVRTVLFFSTCFAVYLFFGNVKLIAAIIIAFIILFLILISRHTNLKHKKEKCLALIDINKTELNVLARDFYEQPTGLEYGNPLHFYSNDIDLFGKGSFYQYSNRTALQQGSNLLAQLFTENCITNIVDKQEAIKELSIKAAWRQDFSATATLVKTTNSSDQINSWLKSYTYFTPAIMQWLPLAYSVVSLAVLAGYFTGFVAGYWAVICLLVGLGISGVFMKKISKLGTITSKIQSTFAQYNKLITSIEGETFTTTLLKNKKESILKEGKKTSLIIKEFSDLLGQMDQNNNIFYLLLANGFFLRALATSYKIEQWIKLHGSSVDNWFKTVAFFDAYNSLGNFAYNHSNYSFPEITNNSNIIKAAQAGHPLLNPEKSVLNDFIIKSEEFFIITGANMAGKSTFLRTVSLHIVMANMGLPVCASKVEYSPIKLITSMRTTDSLTDDESYFFSELKRLKFVVDEVKKDTYFIVLDEILKGTNSTDKAIGSRKFVEKLVASKSTGIIATHDLSLCETANEIPQIKNHYFDAEIINNELHFDYRFKNGVCKNMNASFLLRKMKIVD